MHDEFPVSIDLAIHPMDESDFPAVLGKVRERTGKVKPVYPSLYISGAKNLESLPREGYALIHFKRRSITMGERDGESNCSADLEIHEINLPDKSSQEDSGDMADAMKSLAKGMGIDTGSGSDQEEASETDSEEADEGDENDEAETEK